MTKTSVCFVQRGVGTRKREAFKTEVVFGNQTPGHRQRGVGSICNGQTEKYTSVKWYYK